MTIWGYISGNGDRRGFVGLRVTRTSNTTPQNSDQCRTKLGSAEPRHLGEGNNRGVQIKMLIGLSSGGGVYIATPLVVSLNLSGQIHASPHLAQQVQGHQRGRQHLQHPRPGSEVHHPQGGIAPDQ